MLNAIATDDQGLSAQGSPVILHVVAPPALSIQYKQGLIVIDWIPAEAILESAPSLTGRWQPVADAKPPLRVPPDKSMFYRARLP